MIKSNIICATKLTDGETTVDLTSLTKDYNTENMKKCNNIICCDKISNGQETYSLEDIKKGPEIPIEYVRISFDGGYFYRYDEPDNHITDSIMLQFKVKTSRDQQLQSIGKNYFKCGEYSIFSDGKTLYNILLTSYSPGGVITSDIHVRNLGSQGIAYVDGTFKRSETDIPVIITKIEFLNQNKDTVFTIASQNIEVDSDIDQYGYCKYLYQSSSRLYKFGTDNLDTTQRSTLQ